MTLNIHIVKPYLHLMRLDRPIGTLLLLWPTLIALWLAADNRPDPKLVLIFALGVLIMRAAGCVINDYADRDFDPFVARTKNRPLAVGAVSAQNAKILCGILFILAFMLVLNLNPAVIGLSFVGAGLALIYPFAKRFTYYPQFILGLAFSWGIPMVYAQVQGELGLECWLLYLSTMAWVVAYDTQYAMVDKNDDLKIGIKSTAIIFGDLDKAIIFSLQILSLVGFAIIGAINSLDYSYFFGLLLALSLVIYQQWLIKDRSPALCFKAFINNNYFGAVIFIGVLFATR